MQITFVSSFVATADLGSFSKAAESLFSTQATIASRVARLEQELGVQLFLRDGSTLVLTEHGHAALPFARKLLQSNEDFVRAAGGRNDAEGTLRIAWTDYVSFLLQPGFLNAAAAKYPLLNFDFSTQSSLDVLERLQEGRVDIAVLVGTEAKPNVVSRHLFDLQLSWICKSGTLATARPDQLSTLETMPIIDYPVGTLPSQAIHSQIEGASLQAPRIFRFDALQTVLAAVRDGVGIALIPPSIVKTEILENELVVLDIPSPVSHLSFHAQFRENARADLCHDICDLMEHLVPELVFQS